MKNKNRILNVGCGSETYGTDFLDIYPSRKGVKKCNLNLEKFPFESNNFDEVYSKNLFEHIADLPHLLGEMSRVLKKGGKLHVLTDNAGFFLFHLPIRKNNFLQHYSNSVRFGKEDRHYFLFTPMHLVNWLNLAGEFENIKIKYHYASGRRIVRILSPFFTLLNKTFLKRIINPHIIIEAYKK